MLILVWLLILAVIVGMVFVVSWCADNNHDVAGATLFTVCLLAGIAWVVFSIAGVARYVGSVSDYGDLRGIRDSFVSVERAIEMTKESVYAISEKVLFDATNLKQSTNVFEAISNARNTILEYNRKLQKYLTLRSYPLTRPFCAPVPTDLKPLVWAEK